MPTVLFSICLQYYFKQSEDWDYLDSSSGVVTFVSSSGMLSVSQDILFPTFRDSVVVSFSGVDMPKKKVSKPLSQICSDTVSHHRRINL